MPTIRRDDGTHFVIQPYRELFVPEKASALKRKIRVLSQTQGDNVRLYKLPDGRIEAVFSRDAGALLGETLWYYLKQPINMIYCEALAERRHALVVIARNGIVFLDAQISFTNLLDELTALSTSDENYAIYTCGDVPLGEHQTEDKFALPSKNVSSFKILENSVLQLLVPIEETQLQPLELALTSPLLGKPKTIPMMITIIVVIAIIFFWQLFSSGVPPEIPKIQISREQPFVDPFADYYKMLMTPAPKKVLAEMVAKAQLVSSLPGWDLGYVDYNGSQYIIDMLAANDARLTPIQSWAKLNRITYVLQSGNIRFVISSAAQNRSKPHGIYPLRQTLALLVDQVNQLLEGGKADFGEISPQGQYESVDVKISFANLFAGKVVLLGYLLDNFPVSIARARLTMNNDLFSGSISLQVLGD